MLNRYTNIYFSLSEIPRRVHQRAGEMLWRRNVQWKHTAGENDISMLMNWPNTQIQVYAISRGRCLHSVMNSKNQSTIHQRFLFYATQSAFSPSNDLQGLFRSLNIYIVAYGEVLSSALPSANATTQPCMISTESVIRPIKPKYYANTTQPSSTTDRTSASGHQLNLSVQPCCSIVVQLSRSFFDYTSQYCLIYRHRLRCITRSCNPGPSHCHFALLSLLVGASTVLCTSRRPNRHENTASWCVICRIPKLHLKSLLHRNFRLIPRNTVLTESRPTTVVPYLLVWHKPQRNPLALNCARSETLTWLKYLEMYSYRLLFMTPNSKCQTDLSMIFFLFLFPQSWRQAFAQSHLQTLKKKMLSAYPLSYKLPF